MGASLLTGSKKEHPAVILIPLVLGMVPSAVDRQLQQEAARRSWNLNFKELKDSHCQPIIQYPEEVSFQQEMEITTFLGHQK